jgi:Region found in RelA / SpoT proteins
VSNYPSCDYSMQEVRRVGKIVAANPPLSSETLVAFDVANNYRDAHMFPMRSMRGSLAWYMGYHQIAGVTGARLKRMQSIRRKMKRIGLHLNQFQDLAGCRAVVASIADVRALVEIMRKCRHHLRDEDDYIANPKKDGYRSHHLMFNYVGKGVQAIHSGRRVEVQIRSRMQHSWATTVEAIGLFRGEDLKGNQGSPDWLRLFQLMSAEFAQAEQCAEPLNVPARHLRVQEIADLDRKLKASETLDNLSYAVKFTDTSVAPSQKSQYWLIQFDNAKREVRISPYSAPRSAALSYDNAEYLDTNNEKNIVLVETDKLEHMKAAYPNYFGDVQLFRMQLRRIIKGKGATEYTVKPQESVMPRPREAPNLAWLKRRNQIRWV